MINLSYLAAATCAKLSRGVCYSQEFAVFPFFTAMRSIKRFEPCCLDEYFSEK